MVEHLKYGKKTNYKTKSEGVVMVLTTPAFQRDAVEHIAKGLVFLGSFRVNWATASVDRPVGVANFEGVLGDAEGAIHVGFLHGDPTFFGVERLVATADAPPTTVP
jgi:hypothetical protein